MTAVTQRPGADPPLVLPEPGHATFAVARVGSGDLRLEGPLTGETAPLLLAAVDPLLRLPAPRLRLFLHGVTDVDYAGAVALVRTDRRVRARGGRMQLCQLSAPARRLLEASGLAHWLTVDDGPADAERQRPHRRATRGR